MHPLLIALYVGPDQVMPVMSVLATIAGLVMVFWNKVLSIVRRIFGAKRSSDADAAPGVAPATGSEPPNES
ncbi:MAG: hypothetical protein ACRD5W_17340 [Candidatus Acidiferrales bacterium]